MFEKKHSNSFLLLLLLFIYFLLFLKKSSSYSQEQNKTMTIKDKYDTLQLDVQYFSITVFF